MSLAVTEPFSDIPRVTGMPVIGSTMAFLKNPRQFVADAQRRYGDIFWVNYFFEDYLFLLGPEANRLVLTNQDKGFSSKLGWEFMSKSFDGGLMLLDFEHHRHDRRVLQTAFKSEAMNTYLPGLSETVEKRLAGWSQGDQVTIYNDVKGLLLSTAVNTFFGLNDCDLERLNKKLIHLLEGTLGVLPQWLPGSRQYMASKARISLKEELLVTLAEKKRQPSADLFSALARASLDGTLSDTEIVDHLIFLLMAAHDTTASAITTMVNCLCDHPEVQAELRKQALQFDFEQLNLSSLSKLDYFEAAINEALRLYTPVQSLPRKTIKPVEFAGFTIPQGIFVMVSPDNTHNCKAYWSDPSTFNPDRFLSQRIDPWAWLPFGSGVHKCIGLHFAYVETKLFLLHALRRFEFSHASPDNKDINLLPMPAPKNGLEVNLREL